MLREACRPEIEVGEVDGHGVEIVVPIRLKHRSSSLIVAPADRPLSKNAKPDRALVRAVCIARDWGRRLESGEVESTFQLAKLEGLCKRHAGRLLPLAWLAPDLIDDRQPRAMTLQALTAKPIPRGWDDQRRLVASFA